MKRITIVSIIIILVTNLIFCKNVEAYPSIIDGSIQEENLTQIENAIDPGIVNSLAEEGTTTIHKGTSNGDGSYTINDETTTVNSTNNSSGSVAGILAGIINIFPTIINSIMSVMVLSQQPDSSTIEEFTIQDLVFNNFRLFDINYFDIEVSGTDANNIIKKNVSKWYVAVQRLAIVISLCMLIFLGINMAITNVASDKVKYKEMLIDWVCGFILIFLLQYLVAIFIFTGEGILELLPKQETNLEQILVHGDGKEIGIEGQMEETKGWNFVTSCILYWILVYYQVKFLILYLKRLLVTSTLIVISPIVCVCYPIDNMKTKKDKLAQASFKIWLKELLVNIYIQPVHALMYIVFISSAAEIAKTAPLFAILFLAALSRSEKIIKNIFNMRGMSSISSLGTIKVGVK